MSEDLVLKALQKITAGDCSLGELIGAATGLVNAGQVEAARQVYRAWLGFNREHPQAYVALFNCASLETQEGDLVAAIESLRSAIALNPGFIPAYINLGGSLERSGALDEGIEVWRTAVTQQTAVTGTAVNFTITALRQIARVLAEHQRNAAAEAAVRHALELNGHQKDVLEQYIALRLAQCKWPIIEPWEGVDRRMLMSGIHPLSMAVFTDDPLLQLGAANAYSRQAVNESPADDRADRRHAPIDLENRRLRVGYISSDLRDHAIGYLMAELFELHDRAKIEVFAYYCGIPPTGALNARIRSSVEHWADIRNMGDDEAAQLIADDGIDILVDVNGHTRDAKTAVFARRPAPIQVNWLGFPGTMGTPYHHYVIADEWIIPEESELYYSEKVVRLPCYQSNDRKRTIAPERPTRADAGLPEDAFVFCCFNGTHKISRFTFDRWLQILKRTPDSVLWLLHSSDEANEQLRRVAEQNGVDRARLIFAPKQANAQHLARYPLADLFLDTSPYGAHTTASDALWMAVPVLTLSGRGFAARVCGSLVRAAGLPELVCSTSEEYVDRAVALGTDRAVVQSYKARLEAGRLTCDLFNTDKLVTRLEDLYRGMCADYLRGALPRPDLTNLDAYLEVGVDHDHEAQEVLSQPDYVGRYKAALSRRHMMRPMRADDRIWTVEDIVALEPESIEPSLVVQPMRRRRAAG